jgi:glyoxylase-like metal-dependent hydrolase (beta-lactamase superfamily II)
LLSCPTASIGAAAGDYPRLYISRLPMPLARDVYYCGFNSRRSYGANSYFITAGEGNWLIDSPRFVSHLVTRFREMGGLRYIFLTHQDDVADAAKYAAEFGAKMIIHEADADAMPSAHIKVSGTADCHYADNITVIPTPGHTRGHCVLLFRDEYLFTGDHLAWDREQQKLEAFDDFCWYSWEEQKQSLAKLLNYNFRFVLSGHGQRHNFADTAEAHSALRTLVEQL